MCCHFWLHSWKHWRLLSLEGGWETSATFHSRNHTWGINTRRAITRAARFLDKVLHGKCSFDSIQCLPPSKSSIGEIFTLQIWHSIMSYLYTYHVMTEKALLWVYIFLAFFKLFLSYVTKIYNLFIIIIKSKGSKVSVKKHLEVNQIKHDIKKHSPAHFPSLAGDTSRPLPSTHTLIPANNRYTEHTDSQAAVTAPSQNSGVSTARNTCSLADMLASNADWLRSRITIPVRLADTCNYNRQSASKWTRTCNFRVGR